VKNGNAGVENGNVSTENAIATTVIMNYLIVTINNRGCSINCVNL
jgi:hypothetical protein